MLAVVAYAVLSASALWWFEGAPTAARVPIGLPLFLFAPGYAVVAALFPPGPGGLSRLEQWALAVVASIAVVPMIALVATVTGGIELPRILAGVAVLTVVASAVAIIRVVMWGTRAPALEPYREPAPNPSSTGGATSVRTLVTDRVTLLAITVTALLLTASAGIAYTEAGIDQPVAASGGDQLLTEFYLVDEPRATNGSAETSERYHLRIDQHGDDPQRYTVVVMLDRSLGANRSWIELDRESDVVDPGETAAVTHRLSGSELDSNATVRFMLYTGDAPSSPDPDTAHRVLTISGDLAEG